MAKKYNKLNKSTRDAMPKKEFGLPNKKAYPVEDRGHAQAAKFYAAKEYRAGKLSKKEYEQIIRKANATLVKTGSNAKDLKSPKSKPKRKK
ncbi:MAG: hypothetical protein JKY50_22760 [Oleispira sp.]|nr:hypothetical protein [Oleispira sp.]